MGTRYSIAAAARLCGCPRSTLQRAIRAGRLHLDVRHQLTAEDLTRAGYLPATAAQQPQAPAAQQPRSTPMQDLTDLLRDMQRTMERLAAAVEILTQKLHTMQQQRGMLLAPDPAPVAQQPRSSRAPYPPGSSQQPRSMEPQQPAPQAMPTHYGRPGLAPETLQAIAAARARAPGLTLRAFAQHLFDEGIYRGQTRDGRPVPADHSRLRRWLQQARAAGMLAEP
jgi:uncharacterized coiled-coil protein SlyX